MTHNLFSRFNLNEAGYRKTSEALERFSEIADWIENHVPEGRERSIVMSHLQDAGFHTTRALAERPENHDDTADGKPRC